MICNKQADDCKTETSRVIDFLNSNKLKMPSQSQQLIWEAYHMYCRHQKENHEPRRLLVADRELLTALRNEPYNLTLTKKDVISAYIEYMSTMLIPSTKASKGKITKKIQEMPTESDEMPPIPAFPPGLTMKLAGSEGVIGCRRRIGLVASMYKPVHCDEFSKLYSGSFMCLC